MKPTILSLMIAAAVLAPQAAFSQEAAPAAVVQADAEPKEKVFGAGDFDLLANLGFNIVYVHAEPAVDIGVIPLGDDFTVSVGGGVGLGYCLLCGAISALSDVNVSSTYWFPYGRANFHIGTLGGLIPDYVEGVSLDPYLGFYAGPQFYKFKVDFDDSSTVGTVSQTSIRLGPVGGMRAGFKDNTLLLFGEYRLGAEFGFTTATVENQDGTVYDVTADDYARRGSDFIVGFGLRI